MSNIEEIVIDGCVFHSFETEEECRKVYGKFKNTVDFIAQIKPELIVKRTRFISSEPRTTNKETTNIKLETNFLDEYKYFPKKRENTVQKQGNTFILEPKIIHTRSHSTELDIPRARYIKRPQKTYLQLINEAFSNLNRTPFTTHEICQFIANKYPYYNLNDDYWQKGVSVNMANTQHFKMIVKASKKNVAKYIPIKQEIEKKSELNILRMRLKLAEEELKSVKDSITRNNEEHLKLMDLLKCEFHLKITEFEEKSRVIGELLSNYVSKCIQEIDYI
jgi:hypothetical protein